MFQCPYSNGEINVNKETETDPVMIKKTYFKPKQTQNRKKKDNYFENGTTFKSKSVFTHRIQYQIKANQYVNIAAFECMFSIVCITLEAPGSKLFIPPFSQCISRTHFSYSYSCTNSLNPNTVLVPDYNCAIHQFGD